MLRIALKSPIPIYEQLIEGIQSMIKSGELKPGDPLPPIRTLAGQLEVSINTVARAYLELERIGSIVSNGRKGSFVKDIREVESNNQGGLFKENILTLIKQGYDKEDIIALFHKNLNDIYS